MFNLQTTGRRLKARCMHACMCRWNLNLSWQAGSLDRSFLGMQSVSQSVSQSEVRAVTCHGTRRTIIIYGNNTNFELN